MIKEFKTFIATGNVVDLAVGVILGAAIGGVVSAFVADIAMPIVSHFIGGLNFSSLKTILDPAVLGPNGEEIMPENAINYGKWLNAIVNLICVGLVLFFIVRSYNKIRKPVEAAGPTEIDLLTEIRDALKK